MLRKICLVALLGSAMSLSALGEAMRPLFALENKFPDPRKFEAGASFDYTEDTIYNGLSAAPYLRWGGFGLLERFTLSAEVPYLFLDSDVGDEQGLGDVVLGLDLAAYDNDHGDLGFIVPYIRQTLATGDEDRGLGSGESMFTFGTSLGAVIYEFYTLVADGRYTFRPDEDNLVSGTLGVIWDVSRHLAVIVEATASDEKDQDGDYPYYLTGAMSYKLSDRLMMRWGGGIVENSEQDTVASFKAACTF